MSDLTKNIFEILGFDWLTMLIGKRPFIVNASPDSLTSNEISTKLKNVRGIKKVDDAIEFCKGLYDHENDRIDKIESKAYSLLGFAGLMTTFTIGFGGLLIDQFMVSPKGIAFTIGILFFFALFSMFFTVFIASRVVSVGNQYYEFAEPRADDIFELSSSQLVKVKLERAASFYVSYVHNSSVARQKATFLMGAQLWFRNSNISLLLLGLMILIHSFAAIPPSKPSDSWAESTPTPIHTPTTTLTSTPTPSPTSTFTHTPSPPPIITPTSLP